MKKNKKEKKLKFLLYSDDYFKIIEKLNNLIEDHEKLKEKVRLLLDQKGLNI